MTSRNFASHFGWLLLATLTGASLLAVGGIVALAAHTVYLALTKWNW
jgi:hypothetical protein